jgi:serine kinase of HPr protein (carbohydrate metabolism regulator)
VKRRFVALATPVELTVDDELGISELAAFLIDAYEPTDAPPAIAYHLHDRLMTAVDRYDDPVADVSDLVPLFELDLYQQVAERAPPGWLLHAATLEKGGRAYVFAGPSGAGKTTLTLGLMQRGWRLVTEEMTLIDRNLSVRGLARPIHADRASDLPASWRTNDYPVRGTAQNVLAHPPIEQRVSEPLRLAAIVAIGHAKDSETRVTPMSAHAALRRLWLATLRKDEAGLAAAVSILCATNVLELSSSSSESALALALSIAK